MNPVTSYTRRLGRACLVLLLGWASGPHLFADEAPPPSSEATKSNAFQIHLLGGWSFGDTDGNLYLGGDEDGDFENGNLAANFSYELNPRLRLAAQIEAHTGEVGEDEEEVELDFLYATYQINSGLQVRLGRVKHAFGIYSEFFDLGTVRPFLELPQSIYGATGIAGENLDGIGLAGSRTLNSGWDFSYDFYFGELELVSSEPWDLLEAEEEEEEEEEEDASELFIEEQNRDEVFGGRLTWGHPSMPLDFGLSAYTGVAEDQELGELSGEDRRDTVFGAHVDYSGELWWIRSEIAHIDQEDEVEALGAYLEVARFVSPTLQLAVRYEYLETDVIEFEVPRLFDDLTEHSDLTLGIAWWFHEPWVAKAGVHFVEGNRFALSEEIFEGELDEVPERDTTLFELGVQFSF